MRALVISICAASAVMLTMSAPRAQSSTTRFIFLTGTTSLQSSVLPPSADPGGTASASAAAPAAHDDVELSFDGLNLVDHRFADDAQALISEPPNPYVCVGNGYVLATVNTALRVFDTLGNKVTSVTSLNTFHRLPPAYSSAGEVGPLLSDPSCVFDPQTGRWFHIVMDMERVGVTFQLSGANHLDLAVSQTSDPLGTWNIYRIPVQDDGTEGTPDHHCTGGPCLGDFPHLGLDENGLYVTTNEFPFFEPGMPVAQIYAIPKAQLVDGLAQVSLTQISTADYLLDGRPGFTVWGATSPTARYAGAQGGTEYFLSSEAVFDPQARSTQLRIWALSNTQSLNTTPALTLQVGVVDVEHYAWGQAMRQKEGDAPLADCISDREMPTPTGTGCWRLFGFTTKPRKEKQIKWINGQDSRIGQVMFADGKLWSALTTDIKVGGENRKGIAYFVLDPHVSSTSVKASVVQQGYLSVEHNDLGYPAVAVTAGGKGVIGFTLMGDDYYPSSAYATLNATDGAGEVRIAAEGRGPSEGISGYAAFNDGTRYQERWGDWNAAAVDGNRVWIVTEYVGQTCTFEEYQQAPVGRCGGTRLASGNWDTRISRIKP